MIFVTLGTQDKQFPRLLKAVEKIKTREKIVAQVGSTEFKSKKIEIHKNMTEEEFAKYMKKASVIITHAGVGTIIEGLKLNKKMIVAARKKEYKEHVNNHQEQILDIFTKSKYILPLKDFDDLQELINTEFTPKKYRSNRNKFRSCLKKEIERLIN